KNIGFHASIMPENPGFVKYIIPIDFPACHRVLRAIHFNGWLCADLDIARNGPRASYERCGAYVVRKLEPIYA
ncbi:MAG TPA: hypothetical protein VFA65_10655, partial [Bryobacteraceae bacterium]|nr:hypothetical protein [Bryobacteraceae bacterium]